MLAPSSPWRDVLLPGKSKISGTKTKLIGSVSAKNKVYAKRLVEIAAISAKKAKKSAACAK